MSELPNKQIHIVGGGTIEPIRSHLAIAAPAYGTTARQLGELCSELIPAMDVNMHLTRMADPESNLETAADLETLARSIANDLTSKIVFWSPLISDFTGKIGKIPGSKHGDRLQSRDNPPTIELTPTPKIIPLLRHEPNANNVVRKDMFTVGFKTTTGAPKDQQFAAGLRLLKENSLNLVLANDTVTRENMVIVPEEAAYFETTDRMTALEGLVRVANLRSQLSFTRSTVVAGEAVAWQSEEVFPTLRTVVDHCIARGAYRDRDGGYSGPTAGHFAAKINDRTFLTSRRKTNFNNLDDIGLVRVETDGDDTVIAYGSKPSVGGQSQRIVFEQHPERDAIVHFHCDIKPGSKVPVVSQLEYECGSHQCGENTQSGLGTFADGQIEAVFLDNHGPNIVFNHSVEPQVVIDFIEENFDLTKKTGPKLPTT